jgi:D-alanine--poly(phosphoribitol) ligase subunit 1
LSSPDVLADIVEHTRSGPDRPAVKDLDRDLTYGDLLDEVTRVAAGLRSHGVRGGDRVALLLPNSVDFVVVALACLTLGAIFVPLAVSDPPSRLGVIIGNCAPTVVVTSSDNEGAQPALATTSERPLAVTISELSREVGEVRGVGGLVESGPPGTAGAYIIYTSGTTGTPNGALIGRAAFAAAVGATADALGLDRTTRTLCVSPFHFDGSFATLFPTLSCGGAVVIRPREALLFPRTFFRAVASEAITYTGFSPSYLRLLLASELMETLAESHLHIVALGGEASSPADIRALWTAAPDLEVFNRYGPTETTIAVTHRKVTPADLAAGSVPIGQPHPGVTFHLVDGEDRVVETPDQAGELYVGGTQLMTGYWGAPELTADVMRIDLIPGVTLYRTGDLVHRNASGDYVYLDRVDQVINRSGVRISLVEISDTLRHVEGVSAAACLAFDDDGQLGIVAFAVADGSVTALGLRRAASHHLPDTMLPNHIELVEALPLTAGSKLDERRLLAEAGLREFRAAGAPGQKA